MKPSESKNLTAYEIKHRATITFSEEGTKARQLTVVLSCLFNGKTEKLMIKSPRNHNGQQGFGV